MIETPIAQGLSDREARRLRSLAATGRDLFTIAQAQQALGTDAPYAANILYQLAAKGWLRRIERGKYRLIPAKWRPPLPSSGHPAASRCLELMSNVRRHDSVK